MFIPHFTSMTGYSQQNLSKSLIELKNKTPKLALRGLTIRSSMNNNTHILFWFACDKQIADFRKGENLNDSYKYNTNFFLNCKKNLIILHNATYTNHLPVSYRSHRLWCDHTRSCNSRPHRLPPLHKQIILQYSYISL